MSFSERPHLPAYISGFGFPAGQKGKNRNYLNIEDNDLY